jgi:predicted GIY-YIG superfamily endonuclease
MEYKFWVYMVASQTGTLYIGMTNNIERRVSEHKSGEFEDSRASMDATGWCTTRASMRCRRQSIGRNS